MTDARRYIEERSIPVPFVGCWLWLMSLNSGGYAVSNPRFGKTGHRVSFAAFKGAIPRGALVRHSCDMRWCVNPDHLIIGTHQDNSDDKYRRGRSGNDTRTLPPHPNRVLTNDQAAEIRASSDPDRTLALRFGVGKSTISPIRRGLRYRDASKPA